MPRSICSKKNGANRSNHSLSRDRPETVQEILEGLTMVLTIRELNYEDIETLGSWLISDPDFPGDFSPFAWEISKESFLSKVQENLTVPKTVEVKFYTVQRDGSPIGVMLSRKPENFDYVEVGYYIQPAERHKGYGTESLRQFTDFLFKTCGVLRLEAGTSSLNVPSQRILEKAGFTREAIRRKTLFRNGKWEDSYLYALIRE